MNFIEAMQCVEQGQCVRRKHWPVKEGTEHIGQDDIGLFRRTNFRDEGFSVTSNTLFTLADYLADNWRIALPPRKKSNALPPRKRSTK